MASFDWPKYLKECLDSTEFMALATRGAEGLWNHAVYFAYDSHLNLYFMSQPSSRHMHNIAENGEAAAAVFSTARTSSEAAIGLQMRGRASILADDQVPAAHKIYFDRASAIEGIPDDLDDFLGPDAAWKLVKITPEEIGYFNSGLFGEQRQVVPPGVAL